LKQFLQATKSFFVACSLHALLFSMVMSFGNNRDLEEKTKKSIVSRLFSIFRQQSFEREADKECEKGGMNPIME